MKKKSNRNRLSGSKVESLWDIAFVSPQLIIYIAFTILPLLVAIPMLLSDRRDFLDNAINFVGLKNFAYVFSQPFLNDFLGALQRTSIFTILNYSTIYIFGLTLALIMFEYSSRLRRPFFTVIYLPYMISGLGAGMLLTLLFAKDSGSLNLLLMKLGILSTPFDIKSKMVATFALPLMTGWRYAGLNMAFFLGGLLSISTDTIEAATVDGANYRQKLFRIYLPQMVPSIIMASITCLVGSFNLIDELFGLGATYGNVNANFISIMVYNLGFNSGLSRSVTMSFVVFIPLIIIAFVLVRVQKKMQY